MNKIPVLQPGEPVGPPSQKHCVFDQGHIRCVKNSMGRRTWGALTNKGLGRLTRLYLEGALSEFKISQLLDGAVYLVEEK